MTKPIFWLSIAAIASVLLLGSIAVSPMVIAGVDDGDDDDDEGAAPGANCPALTEFLRGLIPPLTLDEANQILSLAGCGPLDGTLVFCDCGIAATEICITPAISCMDLPIPSTHPQCDEFCLATTGSPMGLIGSCSENSC